MNASRDGLKLNGLAVRSWGDVLAVGTLIAMLLSVVAWGLKLESELNAVRADVASIERRIGDGRLAVAEEKLTGLRRDLTYLAEEFRGHEEKHDE